MMDDNYNAKQKAMAAGLGLAFATGIVVIGAVLTGKFPPLTQKEKLHEEQCGRTL